MLCDSCRTSGQFSRCCNHTQCRAIGNQPKNSRPGRPTRRLAVCTRSQRRLPYKRRTVLRGPGPRRTEPHKTCCIGRSLRWSWGSRRYSRGNIYVVGQWLSGRLAAHLRPTTFGCPARPGGRGACRTFVSGSTASDRYRLSDRHADRRRLRSGAPLDRTDIRRFARGA